MRAMAKSVCHCHEVCAVHTFVCVCAMQCSAAYAVKGERANISKCTLLPVVLFKSRKLSDENIVTEKLLRK